MLLSLSLANHPIAAIGAMAVSSGTQSVTLRDGVNIWDKDVTVDQLFTGDVKGRVLLDKLFELYQATVKTQNNKPPSNLVIL